MITCFLCLENHSLTLDKPIKIESKENNVEVAALIQKYFDIDLTKNEVKLNWICQQCWSVIFNFHNLFEFVSDSQRAQKENKDSQFENDPLPLVQEVFSDSVKAPNCTGDVSPDNIFFCPEVKIEETDLEQLPKIEIIENAHSIDVNILESCFQINQMKRHNIEDENTQTKKPKLVTDNIESNEDDEVYIVSHDRSPVTRSSTNWKEKSISKSDEGENEDSDNHLDEEYLQKCTSDEDNSSGSESGSGSFYYESEVPEKYAIVPKRVAVRPKKYKKRQKPLIPPVRMAREEIERRKAQQEEYDKILQKFFNNKFACPICNLLVHNFTDMVRHHRITHKIYQGYMTCCGRKFKQRKTLAEHALVHWDPDHFKCNVCSKVFQNSRLLENHEQTHNNSAESRDKAIFQCDKCPKTFASKSTFDYHNLSKHVPKSELKFICPQCNKRLMTERKLKNHIKSAHDPENAIICDKCGKQMRTKQSLKKHQELMHSDVPRPEPVLMQCQICGTWLKDLRGLKQHMKSIHIESVGEHRCNVCSKVSPNARALRRHIYHNHECERKFKCTMCDKAFKRPQELREHTSTHTGEVLYTCPNCPMTFFCSANMYKHRQRLHRAQYEADKNQPRPPNILQQAVGATAAMKIKLMQAVDQTVYPSRIYLDPTWEQGVNSNILQVVRRLFSVLEFKSNSGEFICSFCWKFVSEFENFYQRICLLHHISENHVDRDPLPVEINTKSIENPSLNDIEDGSVNQDIKFEVTKFNLVCQKELIANAAVESFKSLGGVDLDNDTPISANYSLVKKTMAGVENNESPSNASAGVVIDAEVCSGVSDTDLDSDRLTSNAVGLRTEDGNKKRHKQFTKLSQRAHASREDVNKEMARQTIYNDIISNFFKNVSCPKCEQSLQSFDDMRLHFRTAHNIESGYVTCCGQTFYLRKQLADHLIVHSNPDHFKCKTCARVFQDSRSLVAHEKSHANPVVKSKTVYQCDKCPKTFTTKGGFEHHCSSKHVPRSEFKFTCAECSKKLPTERKLRDHMKHAHDPERAIICEKCGKQVRTQSSLTKHNQREHSDEPKQTPEPVQCEICGTWLRHLSGLKQHKKTMHEQAGGEYRCHICNRASTNARALKRHIHHNHECERKFKCIMCEKAFKRPLDLREHTATHTGEVLYTCPNCPMTFFSNSNMYKHRQRLHRAEWESDRKNPSANSMRKAVVEAPATMTLREIVDVDGSNSIKQEKSSLDFFTQTPVKLLQ